MIPYTNIRHLMLRPDVVDACRRKKFHIWAVKTIDEGLELLTGVKAGRRNARRGKFPKDSVHDRVQARLEAIADQLDGDEKDDRAKAKTKAKSKNDHRADNDDDDDEITID